MSSFPSLLYAKDGEGIATLTLNRPEVINAFNVQMRDDLYQALTAIRDDPSVRGILLQGAGERGFCAGADLTEFGSAPSQAAARHARWARDNWGLMLSISKPFIAAIHGYCLGSGVEIAALCDLRIASEDAIFGMPEAQWGLIPAAGGTQMLPRLLGQGRALDLLLTGRRFTAKEALDYGLVSAAVPQERLEAEALALLRRVLTAPGTAVAAAKRAVQDGADLPLLEALALERRLAALLHEHQSPPW